MAARRRGVGRHHHADAGIDCRTESLLLTTGVTLSYLFAVFSGALLALSFPKYGHAVLAWIALVPLMVAVMGWHGAPGRLAPPPALRAFALGLVAGMVYFVGTIYWTSTVVQTYGGLAWPVAIVAMLLLCAYLALFPALTAVAGAALVARFGTVGAWLIPFAWVATEYARGHLFGGFPWVPLGNSQVGLLPIAQLASVTGVYGLSLLVALVNAAIAIGVASRGRGRARAALVVAILLVGTGAWGARRLGDGTLLREGVPVTVGLLQGNIAQEDKWERTQAHRILTTYLSLTRDARRLGAQFVIWPESATPFLFEEDAEGAAQVRAIAKEMRVPVLFGSDQIERGATPRIYNAAFLVDAEGRTRAVYRKINLVPFGEYIPFKRLLFFVAPLVESLVDFSAGTDVVPLPVDGHVATTAVCYEVVYPELIRQAVVGGSELLTTITNDGWYGHSSAPYQHFALASMRAIEEGRFLVRAANTGISGIVDPYGRVLQASPLFEQAVLVGDVRYLRSITLYARFGDIVALASIALVILALAAATRRLAPRPAAVS